MSRPFLELRTLAALPCGCVVAGYRASIVDLELVSIEAKGPHCLLADHPVGAVLALGERGELDTRELDALAVDQTAA